MDHALACGGTPGTCVAPVFAMCLHDTRLGALRNTSAGFGLIEAIIAAAILVVGVAAVAQVFAIGTRAMAAAHDVTYETVLAMQKLEELRAGSFPDGPVDLQEMVDARGETLPAGADVARSAYRRRWIVEPWPFDPVDAVVITVTVTRPVAMGSPVRFTTLRTRRPS